MVRQREADEIAVSISLKPRVMDAVVRDSFYLRICRVFRGIGVRLSYYCSFGWILIKINGLEYGFN